MTSRFLKSKMLFSVFALSLFSLTFSLSQPQLVSAQDADAPVAEQTDAAAEETPEAAAKEVKELTAAEINTFTINNLWIMIAGMLLSLIHI